MSETANLDLSGVAETLLIPLYIRAMESQRADALIKDERAVELVAQMSLDFSRVKQIPLSEANKLVIILRNREFDRYAQDFLARHPDSIVVHIGCGLDSRFERVDNGRVEWYDLDFPNVIELRRKFIGDEKERYHLLGCSVLDNAWLDMVSAHRQRPFLFLAEGVSMHLKEAQNKSLVLTLRNHFPGAELVFDVYSPVHLWVSNLQTARSGFRCHWGLWHGQEIEGWGDGIRLLDEWGYFDDPTPRLAHIRWFRPIESLLRTLRIYHFQLGKAAG
jgi:O-methyltransferase involved in polyketide biosynthesis